MRLFEVFENQPLESPHELLYHNDRLGWFHLLEYILAPYKQNLIEDFNAFRGRRIWYNPNTKQRIDVGNESHTDYAIKHPDDFGIRKDQLEKRKFRPEYDENLAKDIFDLGWVRITLQGQESIVMQGSNKFTIRKALRDYANTLPIEKAIIEVGHSGKAIHNDYYVLSNYDKIASFVRHGTVKSSIAA